MEGPATAIGRRILIDGMAGSGKTTFADALSAKIGLPVIHLDVHYWKPGWVKPSDDEWRATQRRLLAGDAWISDGNDLATLELRLARADTVILLETPWWTCAFRAFMRGLSKPVGEMPEGCEDSAWRRLRDEWRLVGVILRNRNSEAEQARAIVAEHGRHAAVRTLSSKRATRTFLDGLGGD
jgi:adenylate kinase family enzyme